MLNTLAVIEEIFKEFVGDNDQAFCQVKGPFYVLDRIQNALIALQNMLFSESTKLDMDIKTLCTVMVTYHKEAVPMKEKMELSIAMQEMADSKISKTFDHDIANRMIDSMRGHCGPVSATLHLEILPKKLNWQIYYKHTRHLKMLVTPLILITFFPKL